MNLDLGLAEKMIHECLDHFHASVCVVDTGITTDRYQLADIIYPFINSYYYDVFVRTPDAHEARDFSIFLQVATAGVWASLVICFLLHRLLSVASKRLDGPSIIATFFESFQRYSTEIRGWAQGQLPPCLEKVAPWGRKPNWTK